MIELIKRYKIAIVVSIFLSINIGIAIYQTNNKGIIELVPAPINTPISSLIVEEEKVVLEAVEVKSTVQPSVEVLATPIVQTQVPVYICGCIKKPGVYYVSTEAIVNDIILLSGGFTDEADQRAINLAAPICANEKIVVPYVGEELPITQPKQDVAVKDPSEMHLISINRDDKERLMNLPGIGEVKAQAIISYREDIGMFQSVEALKEVSGIGDKTYEKLKELITIE